MTHYARRFALFYSLFIVVVVLGVVAQSGDEAIVCPSNTRDDDQRPVILSTCESICGSTNTCVYYPYKYRDQCTGLVNRCMRGTECGYECFSGNVKVYKTWDDLSDVFLNNPDMEDARNELANASIVNRWEGDITKYMSIYGETFDSLRDMLVPKYGPFEELREPYDFEFSNAIVDGDNSTGIMMIYSVRCPAFDFGSKVFPSLTQVYLMNCGLTKFPFASKSLPSVSILSVSHNPLGKIPDLSPGIMLFLAVENIGLTQPPTNIRHLTSLGSLRLDHNPMGNIPEGTLPPVGGMFLKNCSLTEIPKDLTSIANLGTLDLSYNDLGDSFDQEQLPETIAFLDLAYCNINTIPNRFSKLRKINLSGNKVSVDDLTNLPDTMEILVAESVGWTQIPSSFGTMFPKMVDLHLKNNPIEKLNVEDLPSTLSSLALNGTLIDGTQWPTNITHLNITHSQLKAYPLPFSQAMTLVNVGYNQIASVDFLNTEKLYIDHNQLETFSSSLAGMTVLDLSFNRLRSYAPSEDSKLTYLNLRGNQFTSVPDAILDAKSLRVLDLRDNPIRKYVPSSAMLNQLLRIPVVRMDPEQFRTNCKFTIQLKEHLICDPLRIDEEELDTGSDDGEGGVSSDKSSSDATSANANSPMSMTVIAVIVVGIVVVVVLLGSIFWYRRRQRVGPKNMSNYSASTEISNEGAMWQDDELQRHRLDARLLQVTRLLATGTYGQVFLATYQDQKVALKRLKNHDSSRAEIQQFVSEIKMMATFRFPKIVRFMGVVWTKESDIAVVTEYMENGDLRTYLDSTRRKARDGWTVQKHRIALDIAEALVYLHSLDPPMIHRDLKSCNVLLDREMSGCLSDFGTTRVVDDASTMTAAVGTALWMAPEVLSGRRYDQSADIYSLGAILSELDTHRLPFHDQDESMTSDGPFTIGKATSGALRLRFLPSCPSSISELATRCTALDPSDRPSTLEVAYELRGLLRMETRMSVSSLRPSKSSRPSLGLL
ncbi:hypothetical protein Poli38472_010923 [Pythium oligandrum]|uniref:Protein kinase domain-containing protein n=1 Tax=Pythium oligandrum TaxID=41045 RepID=A0A8K1FFN7_PYTOL|nr:hypothetical protein Poli38472_010923 [Pythium oligandrum]|eukprot:TMW61860.1 hypothetical protein Poli38472_010923 [Pythium oligandrum]